MLFNGIGSHGCTVERAVFNNKRRALLQANASICHAFGGNKCLCAALHVVFPRTKKPHSFLGPYGCVYLLSITACNAPPTVDTGTVRSSSTAHQYPRYPLRRRHNKCVLEILLLAIQRRRRAIKPARRNSAIAPGAGTYP